MMVEGMPDIPSIILKQDCSLLSGNQVTFVSGLGTLQMDHKPQCNRRLWLVTLIGNLILSFHFAVLLNVDMLGRLKGSDMVLGIFDTCVP